MATYDLTTVAAVKAWIGTPATPANPDLDALLARLVKNASLAIINNLNRDTIVPMALTERYDGYGWGQPRLVLRNWPVVAVTQIYIEGMANALAAMPAPAPGVAMTYPGYRISPLDLRPPGSPQILDFYGVTVPSGRQNVAVSYVAGYQTVEAGAVPGSAAYTVTAQQPFGAWALDMGVTLANGTALVAVTGAPASGQYSVVDGVYTFNAAQAGAAVVLTYGYVPADLAQAAIEWIALENSRRGWIGLVSKSLGGQESVSFSQAEMPRTVDLMLQPYRFVGLL